MSDKNETIKCPQCGFLNPAGSKFCNQCGSPLLSPSIKKDYFSLATKHIPEKLREKIRSAKFTGERKNVTVLFADITGFTSLSEKLDPEEVTELINRCFESMIDVIYKFEGTIDKFIGDCIMALFGAPITHEDDPERAVYTALNIMDALDRFNSEQGTKLSIHIGINSGVVVAGGVGSNLRMDYTVMGDTVNLAERLMEEAKDEILISESVYKKTSHIFETIECPPTKFKGKSKAVKIYRVIGIKEKPLSKRRLAELHSELVDREMEIQKLLHILSDVKKGKSAVALILGEAGIGKSRLIEVFREKSEKNILWLSGKSYTYGENKPFYVFRTQLSSYFGINQFSSKSEITKKLHEEIERIFKKKSPEYLPYIYQFLSVEIPEQFEGKIKYLDPKHLLLEEFVSIKTLLSNISHYNPLVLYFEDAQSIDAESLELLNFLLNGLRNSPILFLFEARPEKRTDFFSIKNIIRRIYKKRFTEIRLNLLSQSDADTLIQNLLGTTDLPKKIKTLILEKSEGNPFYIEEILHSFIDEEALIKKDNQWQFGKDITSFEIPDSIDAVVRSRIDRLPENIKDVLNKASVIGKSFSYRILSFLCQTNKLDAYLHYLEDHEFIELKLYPGYKSNTPKPRVQTPFGIEFQFKHNLIRDIAYKGLLKKQKKEIHKKAAEFMEKILGKRMPEYYEILAYHYSNADIFDKSFEYYKKAGERAKETYRNETAIRCFKRAIEIQERFHPDERKNIAELYEKSGDVKTIIAEYDEAYKDFKNAFENYRGLEQKANIKRKIGNILFNKGEYANAEDIFKKVLEMLENHITSPVLSETLIDYAWFLTISKGDFSTAEKLTKEALNRINKQKYPKIYAQGLNTLGGITYKKGDYDMALNYYKKTLHIYENLTDKKHIAISLNNIGSVYFYKGDLDTALKYSLEYLNISSEIGDKQGVSRASGNIGDIYKNKGDFEAALKYAEKDLKISEEIGDKQGIIRAYNYIGGIYYAKGDLNTALKYAQKHLSISKEIINKAAINLAYNNIAIIYSNLGKLDDALIHFEKNLESCKEMNDTKGQSIACINIGNIYLKKGKFESALKYYNDCLGILEKIGDKQNKGIVYTQLGNLYGKLKDIDRSYSYLKKAEAIFKEKKDMDNLSKVYSLIANLNIEKDEYKKGIKLSEKALNLAREFNAIESEIIALRTLGKTLSKLAKTKKLDKKSEQNTLKEAISHLKESVAIAKREGLQTELARSLNDLGTVLNLSGEKEEAEKYLKEARTIFTKMDITP